MSLYLNGQPYCWYAVYTKSRAEKKVKAELDILNIENYLPLKKEKRKWSDRVKIVEEPLLRGYIFVRVSNKEHFNVLSVNGAVRYVQWEGKPAVIPQNQIDVLKTFLLENEMDIEATTDRITKGDMVRLVVGPFSDLAGEVVEIRGRKRLLIRFKSLGYCVHAKLEENEIEILRKIG